MEITKETLVTVEMEASQWATVLHALDEEPRKLAQPVWDKINGALVAKARELMTPKVEKNEEQIEETVDQQVDDKVKTNKDSGKTKTRGKSELQDNKA